MEFHRFISSTSFADGRASVSVDTKIKADIILLTFIVSIYLLALWVEAVSLRICPWRLGDGL